MNKQQILERAIQKAIDGGWNWFGIEDHYEQCNKCGQETFHTTPAMNELYHSYDGGKWIVKTRQPYGYWDNFEELYILPYHDKLGGDPVKRLSILDIIFNHDFAKALWGEEVWTAFSDFEGNEEVELYVWQYHLQQMVIAEDPIKYLGDNLGE